MQAIEFAIVFVNYGSYGTLDRLFESQAVPPGMAIVVVDNTPHDEQDSECLEKWRRIDRVDVVVASPENLGYMGGARYALAQHAWLADARFVALANTDLQFSFLSFVKFFATHAIPSDVGLIAPRLVASDGSPVRQLHYSCAPRRDKYERLARLYGRYPLAVAHRLAADLKRSLRRQVQGGSTEELFAPHGALIIFTRAYLGTPGALDHPAFLFCEETYIGLMCQGAGLRCQYQPDLTYSHENHGAMGSFPSRQIVKYLEEAHSAMLPMLGA